MQEMLEAWVRMHMVKMMRGGWILDGFLRPSCQDMEYGMSKKRGAKNGLELLA